MNLSAPRPEIRVAAAVIRDAAGRVLLAQRPDGKHMAGYWEFPGGKLEPDESLDEGLSRELREELGIDAGQSVPVIEIGHDYPDRRVRLLVREIEAYSGTPEGLEGQPLAWVAPDEMDARTLLPADKPAVRALRLPHACLVTPDPETTAGFDAFLEHLETACRAGYALIQLRAPSLGEGEYRTLAREAVAIVGRHAGRLLLHDTPVLAEELGAAGVHLSARRAANLDRRPVPGTMWLGVSCHDGGELERAGQLDADFATLGNVRATASHPGRTGMGWQRFGELVRAANLPVFAIGGLARDDTEAARRAGGQGIAAIRSLWPADASG